MNASAGQHPPVQTLKAYCLGKLDDEPSATVESHLEGCAECRGQVASISGDTFLGRLRDAQKDQATNSFFPGDVSSLGRPSDAPPASDTLPPGLANHPDYAVVRELGRGGMGVVYLAHNKLLRRDEVLKIIEPEILQRPGVLDRFLREMQIVARLRHPHIVSAYSAFRLGESLVFAMEYVDGLDLSRVVKARGGALPVAHAALFCHQVALGLQHAHEEGLVHRDIKPGNLMLSRKGARATVKILDFGLAKVAREEPEDTALTRAGQTLGTPDFIAPEQIFDAQSADIRADIYSLGATLFYLLAGRAPFQGSRVAEVYQAHISRDAEPLNLLRPEVPSELAALVAKMMAKEPKRRFQTPGEVARALTPFFKKPGPLNPADRTRSTTTATPPPTRPASRISPAPSKPAAAASYAGMNTIEEDVSLLPKAPVLDPPRNPPGNGWLRAVAAGLIGFVLLGGIVITIYDREGRKTKIELPEGYRVEIGAGADSSEKAAQPVPKKIVDPIPAVAEQPRPQPKAAPDTTKPSVAQAPSLGSRELVTNSIGTQLRLIPAGSFLRGATPGDKDASDGEKPQRKVTISKPFYIGVFEVTQSEYRQVMNENPSHFKGSEKLPVEQVSWLRAVEFCNKLSEREKRRPYYRIEGDKVTILGGNGYRLPTEAEWEYACRATQSAETATKHPFGDADDEVSSYGWFGEGFSGNTHPVGLKKPNRWGLYDMQGNVWEWCQDWYEEDYYASAPELDPPGPAEAFSRVNRGGSWFEDVGPCRPWFRGWDGPERQVDNLGFRVAADQ